MSRTTALRPCLKHSTDLDPPPSANSSPFPFALCPAVMGTRVHFPPTPSLCQTHLTHSPAMYDRAPIVVLPNACALPARHERTYPPSSECPSSSSPPSSKKRRSTHTMGAQAAPAVAHHPHAFREAPVASSDPRQHHQQLPQLVPDLSSSESDESDINIVPPDRTHFASTGHPPISIIDCSGEASAAYSFLPHANEREKPRRERSRTRGSPRSVRKSEFALPDLDGCLGGF